MDGRLVNHDFSIGQGQTFSFCTARQQESAEAGGKSDAYGGHVTPDELHGIVDGKPCRDRAAGAVDIELDVFFRVLGLKEQHLGRNQAG